jgi:hypothetical protein
MTNKTTIAMALGAGILGGMLTRYVAPPSVSAQDKAPVTREMRAQSFVLVDPADRVVGTFSTEPARGLRMGRPPQPLGTAPRNVVLRDSTGHLLWSTDGGVVPLRAELK